MNGEDVLVLQQSLNYLGFGPVVQDAVYGNTTVKAVKAFQKAQKLSADGIAGKKTLSKLRTLVALADQYAKPARTLKRGTSGEDVYAVQWRLKIISYYSGSLDGKYGSKTVSAVKKYQKSKKLKVDGICGNSTLNILFPDKRITNPVPPIETQVPQDTPAPTQTPLPTLAPTSVPTITPSPTPDETNYPTLKKGSTGPAVARLQAALALLDYRTNTYGFYQTYDNKTVSAVKDFQAKNGLKADGIAGQTTQKLLYSGKCVRGAYSADIPDGTGMMDGPDISKVKPLFWFTNVKPMLSNKQKIRIWDPATKLSWNYLIMSNGRHCDVEPATTRDTAIMYRAFGNQNDWGPKVVYAQLPNGMWVISSTHNVPHGGQTIRDNNFNGQNCLHFLRTMSEARQNDPKYGVPNQEAIRKYWKLMTGVTIGDS